MQSLTGQKKNALTVRQTRIIFFVYLFVARLP